VAPWHLEGKSAHRSMAQRRVAERHTPETLSRQAGAVGRFSRRVPYRSGERRGARRRTGTARADQKRSRHIALCGTGPAAQQCRGPQAMVGAAHEEAEVTVSTEDDVRSEVNARR